MSSDRLDLESALRRHVGGEVRFDTGSRAVYAADGSNYRQVPIGVVIPRDADDVLAAVATCREHQAPILCRGGGTSLPPPVYGTHSDEGESPLTNNGCCGQVWPAEDEVMERAPAQPAPSTSTEAPFGSPERLIGPEKSDWAAKPIASMAWYMTALPATVPISFSSERRSIGPFFSSDMFSEDILNSPLIDSLNFATGPFQGTTPYRQSEHAAEEVSHETPLQYVAPEALMFTLCLSLLFRTELLRKNRAAFTFKFRKTIM